MDNKEILFDFNESIIVEETSERGYASRQGISITQIISRDSRNRPEFTTEGTKFINFLISNLIH